MKSATTAGKSELITTISYSRITNGVSRNMVATVVCGGAGVEVINVILKHYKITQFTQHIMYWHSGCSGGKQKKNEKE